MTVLHLTGLDPCVRCGFCLSACPTYEATLDEADSPRGRIVLMRALERGEVTATDVILAHHLDRCLGCRACESACPSGVGYGAAISSARTAIADIRPASPAVAAGLWILSRPSRQRPLWWASRLARASGIPTALVRGAGAEAPAWAKMLAMLAATAPMDRRTGAQTHRRTATASPERAALFRGCVMDGLFGHVHDATVRTLAVNGVATVEVPRQVCCGALAAHAGRDEEARALARENVLAFDAAAPGMPVVTDSAGCGAMLKAYGELLADDPLAERALAFAARVQDVSETLVARGPVPAGPLPLRVAYDAPCHLHHAQKVTETPLRLLQAIPEMELVPLEGADRCCGSAGLYSLVEPGLSRAVLGPKLEAIAASGAEVVATGNPGCLMHIGAGALLAGLRLEVRHPVELLDLAYDA